MTASFGEQLRAAREAQGITLREVSEQTRITLRHLEAIEADDFKVLPGGVFNRSFIKSYAKYIGFDEAKALQLYQESSREQGTDEENSFAQNQPKVYTDDRTARSPMTNLVLVGGALLLFGLAIYGFVRWFGSSPAPAAMSNPTPTPTPDVMASSNPTPSDTHAATTTMPGADTPAVKGTPAATPAPGAPTPPPAGSFSVQVRAKEPVMVATGADGAKPTLFRLGTPGETRDYTPQQSLTVEYQEPGGARLEVFVNGQPINVPLKGMGKARISTITINRDDYQKLLQNQTQPQPTPTP